VLIIKIISNCS